MADELEIDDIYLASYFMTCGAVLEKRRKVGNKVFFVFSSPSASLKEMRDNFYSGKAKVNPCQYSHYIMACKKMCFDL